MVITSNEELAMECEKAYLKVIGDILNLRIDALIDNVKLVEIAKRVADGLYANKEIALKCNSNVMVYYYVLTAASFENGITYEVWKEVDAKVLDDLDGMVKHLSAPNPMLPRDKFADRFETEPLTFGILTSRLLDEHDKMMAMCNPSSKGEGIGYVKTSLQTLFRLGVTVMAHG